MDQEMAKLVVASITAIGAVAWLAGLSTMLRASHERRASTRLVAERFEVEGEPRPGTIVGEAEVEGQPEDLSTKLAGLLAREGAWPFGAIRIESRSDREIVFGPSGPSPTGFRGGRIRLTPSGTRTRVDYAIEAGSGRLLVGGWVTVGLGLVALVVGPSLAFGYAIPSPNPGIRGQSIQVLQMVHFLWPPFLFAHLARQPARACRGRIESLIHNLPYT